jgi:hypothetical protein
VYAYFPEFFFQNTSADNLTNEKKLIIIFIVKFRFSAKSGISSCENDAKNENLNEVVIKILKTTLKKSIIFY